MASKEPECSICYEGYNTENKCPRMLSCGHSFCSSCLERLLHGDTIDCPTCRNSVTVSTGVHGLLKNFALLDIVNERAPKRLVLPKTREKRSLPAGNRSKGSHECEACDEKHPANFCCLDCKENMCKLRLSFILATRQVVTIGLFPSRSWKKTLSLLLYPSSAKNTMINSGFSMSGAIRLFVGNASP